MRHKESRNYNTSIDIPTIEQIEAERKRIRYKRRYNIVLRSTIGALIVVAAAAVLVATLWMPVLQIHGTSMAPTLQDGQLVIAVKTGDYKTGEVCALWYGNKLLVKRIIAGPGSWVNIDEDGNVYVDGAQLDEPYLTEKAIGETNLEYPYQVGESKWFVMGDNRESSVDSRNTQVGCISDENMVGRIIFCIWPLSDFGPID